MKKMTCALAASLMFSAAPVLADDDTGINVSAGLKVWNHSFDLKFQQGPDTVRGETKANSNSAILTLTAKKGDFFATASTLMSTAYQIDFGSGFIEPLTRDDLDLAVGWSFKPNYSVVLGQKRLSFSFSDGIGGTETFTDKGAFFGLSGAQQVLDRVFLYESALLAPSMKDKSSPTSSAKFSTIEAGIAYAIDTKTQATLGYRVQLYRLTDSDDASLKGTYRLGGIIFGVAHSF